jgi:hypothetical protein
MTAKDLKTLLADVPDDMQVLIPLNAGEGFTGEFFSPCNEDSGIGGLGTEDLSEEEIKEYQLLNKPIPQKDSFVLVPCGFFQEHEGPHPAMN